MNTDTPETDAAYKNHPWDMHDHIPLEFAQRLERERDEAREETIRTREFMDHGFAKARDELAAVTEQRDRLAEAVNAATILIAAKGRHNTMLAYNGLRDALQSLTPNDKP